MSKLSFAEQIKEAIDNQSPNDLFNILIRKSKYSLAAAARKLDISQNRIESLIYKKKKDGKYKIVARVNQKELQEACDLYLYSDKSNDKDLLLVNNAYNNLVDFTAENFVRKNDTRDFSEKIKEAVENKSPNMLIRAFYEAMPLTAKEFGDKCGLKVNKINALKQQIKTDNSKISFTINANSDEFTSIYNMYLKENPDMDIKTLSLITNAYKQLIKHTYEPKKEQDLIEEINRAKENKSPNVFLKALYKKMDSKAILIAEKTGIDVGRVRRIVSEQDTLYFHTTPSKQEFQEISKFFIQYQVKLPSDEQINKEELDAITSGFEKLEPLTKLSEVKIKTSLETKIKEAIENNSPNEFIIAICDEIDLSAAEITKRVGLRNNRLGHLTNINKNRNRYFGKATKEEFEDLYDFFKKSVRENNLKNEISDEILLYVKTAYDELKPNENKEPLKDKIIEALDDKSPNGFVRSLCDELNISNAQISRFVNIDTNRFNHLINIKDHETGRYHAIFFDHEFEKTYDFFVKNINNFSDNEITKEEMLLMNKAYNNLLPLTQKETEELSLSQKIDLAVENYSPNAFARALYEEVGESRLNASKFMKISSEKISRMISGPDVSRYKFTTKMSQSDLHKFSNYFLNNQKSLPQSKKVSSEVMLKINNGYNKLIKLTKDYNHPSDGRNDSTEINNLSFLKQIQNAVDMKSPNHFVIALYNKTGNQFKNWYENTNISKQRFNKFLRETINENYQFDAKPSKTEFKDIYNYFLETQKNVTTNDRISQQELNLIKSAYIKLSQYSLDEKQNFNLRDEIKRAKELKSPNVLSKALYKDVGSNTSLFTENTDIPINRFKGIVSERPDGRFDTKVNKEEFQSICQIYCTYANPNSENLLLINNAYDELVEFAVEKITRKVDNRSLSEKIQEAIDEKSPNLLVTTLYKDMNLKLSEFAEKANISSGRLSNFNNKRSYNEKTVYNAKPNSEEFRNICDMYLSENQNKDINTIKFIENAQKELIKYTTEPKVRFNLIHEIKRAEENESPNIFLKALYKQMGAKAKIISAETDIEYVRFMGIVTENNGGIFYTKPTKREFHDFAKLFIQYQIKQPSDKQISKEELNAINNAFGMLEPFASENIETVETSLRDKIRSSMENNSPNEFIKAICGEINIPNAQISYDLGMNDNSRITKLTNLAPEKNRYMGKVTYNELQSIYNYFLEYQNKLDVNNRISENNLSLISKAYGNFLKTFNIKETELVKDINTALFNKSPNEFLKAFYSRTNSPRTPIHQATGIPKEKVNKMFVRLKGSKNSFNMLMTDKEFTDIYNFFIEHVKRKEFKNNFSEQTLLHSKTAFEELRRYTKKIYTNDDFNNDINNAIKLQSANIFTRALYLRSGKTRVEIANSTGITEQRFHNFVTEKKGKPFKFSTEVTKDDFVKIYRYLVNENDFSKDEIKALDAAYDIVYDGTKEVTVEASLKDKIKEAIENKSPNFFIKALYKQMGSSGKTLNKKTNIHYDRLHNGFSEKPGYVFHTYFSKSEFQTICDVFLEYNEKAKGQKKVSPEELLLINKAYNQLYQYAPDDKIELSLSDKIKNALEEKSPNTFIRALCDESEDTVTKIGKITNIDYKRFIGLINKHKDNKRKIIKYGCRVNYNEFQSICDYFLKYQNNLPDDKKISAEDFIYMNKGYNTLIKYTKGYKGPVIVQDNVENIVEEKPKEEIKPVQKTIKPIDTNDFYGEKLDIPYQYFKPFKHIAQDNNKHAVAMMFIASYSTMRSEEIFIASDGMLASRPTKEYRFKSEFETFKVKDFQGNLYKKFYPKGLIKNAFRKYPDNPELNKLLDDVADFTILKEGNELRALCQEDKEFGRENVPEILYKMRNNSRDNKSDSLIENIIAISKGEEYKGLDWAYIQNNDNNIDFLLSTSEIKPGDNVILKADMSRMDKIKGRKIISLAIEGNRGKQKQARTIEEYQEVNDFNDYSSTTKQKTQKRMKIGEISSHQAIKEEAIYYCAMAYYCNRNRSKDTAYEAFEIAKEAIDEYNKLNPNGKKLTPLIAKQMAEKQYGDEMKKRSTVKISLQDRKNNPAYFYRYKNSNDKFFK